MLATRTVGQGTSTDTGALEDTVLFGIMPGTDASFCQFWKLEAQNKVLVGSCDLLQGQTLSMPFSQLQVCQQSWHLQLHNASLCLPGHMALVLALCVSLHLSLLIRKPLTLG